MRRLLLVLLLPLFVSSCEQKQDVTAPAPVPAAAPAPVPAPAPEPKVMGKAALYDLCKEVGNFSKNNQERMAHRLGEIAWDREGVPFTKIDKSYLGLAAASGYAEEAMGNFDRSRNVILGRSNDDRPSSSAFTAGCYQSLLSNIKTK